MSVRSEGKRKGKKVDAPLLAFVVDSAQTDDVDDTMKNEVSAQHPNREEKGKGRTR
jgi:hypothetical protein